MQDDFTPRVRLQTRFTCRHIGLFGLWGTIATARSIQGAAIQFSSSRFQCEQWTQAANQSNMIAVKFQRNNPIQCSIQVETQCDAPLTSLGIHTADVSVYNIQHDPMLQRAGVEAEMPSRIGTAMPQPAAPSIARSTSKVENSFQASKLCGNALQSCIEN